MIIIYLTYSQWTHLHTFVTTRPGDVVTPDWPACCVTWFPCDESQNANLVGFSTGTRSAQSRSLLHEGETDQDWSPEALRKSWMTYWLYVFWKTTMIDGQSSCESLNDTDPEGGTAWMRHQTLTPESVVLMMYTQGQHVIQRVSAASWEGNDEAGILENSREKFSLRGPSMTCCCWHSTVIT